MKHIILTRMNFDNKELMKEYLKITVNCDNCNTKYI